MSQDLEDLLKNLEARHGVSEDDWRIKHIAWQSKPGFKRIHQTRFSMFCISAGLLTMAASLILVITKHVSIIWLLGWPLGMGIIFLGRMQARSDDYKDWFQVEATCHDRESHSFQGHNINPGETNMLDYYAIRILCSYKHQGEEWFVTPIISKVTEITSQKGVDRFLDDHINIHGKCTLWVNPKNPLHTSFPGKPTT